MKVIAISGWKQSGKDTAAEHLVSKGYVKLSFASALKDLVTLEYSIPRGYCDDPQFKEMPLEQYPVIPKDDFSLNLAKLLFKEFRTAEGREAIEPYVDPSGAFLGVMGRHVAQLYWTPRALCILKGSTNRAVTSSYWTSKTIENIKQYSGPAVGFVISDLRYKSELVELKQAFGKDLITVRINRFDSVNSTDASENDLNDAKFDVIIENKDSVEEFLQKVDKLGE